VATESLPRKLRRGKRRVPSASHTLDLFGNDALPRGFRYLPDFISREEEQSLLKHSVPLPFRELEFQGFTGKRRVFSFGSRYGFNGGGLSKAEDMPDFLAAIRARVESFAEIAPGRLHQVLITEYTPDVAIALAHGPHGIRGRRRHLAFVRLPLPAAPEDRPSLAAPQAHHRAALCLSAARACTIRVGAQHPRRRKPTLFAKRWAIAQCPSPASCGKMNHIECRTCVRLSRPGICQARERRIGWQE
jgi:hypothetical protein